MLVAFLAIKKPWRATRSSKTAPTYDPKVTFAGGPVPDEPTNIGVDMASGANSVEMPQEEVGSNAETQPDPRGEYVEPKTDKEILIRPGMGGETMNDYDLRPPGGFFEAPRI